MLNKRYFVSHKCGRENWEWFATQQRKFFACPEGGVMKSYGEVKNHMRIFKSSLKANDKICEVFLLKMIKKFYFYEVLS